MVDTIKFSEFATGGDLSNDKITVGLGTGGNTQYNNPWTFLAPGTTADRPAPSAAIQFRLRLNTDLNFYEYYNPDAGQWVELSGSGTGTVNPGLANDLAYYPLNGTAISPVPSQANSVLVTGGTSIPSLSTTLPIGITIPGATITGSTAALLSGSVAAVPVSGTDLTNKTYVDSLFSSGVTSITGTVDQVIASSPTGAVNLSLPQSIATTSTPIFLGFNDSNDLSVLRFGTIASAVNYFLIDNNSTGNNPVLAARGTDTNIGQSFLAKGTGLYRFITFATNIPISFFSGTDDGSGNPRHRTNFSFSDTAQTRTVTFQDADGTVAYLSDVAGTVTSATGTANQVLVNGTSGSAQTGAITLTLPQSIATTSAVQFDSVQFNNNNAILDSNGNIMFAFSPVASSVNYFTVFNRATTTAVGSGPALVATGADADIPIGIQSKGLGILRWSSAATSNQLRISTGTSYQHLVSFNFPDTATSTIVTFQDASGTVAYTSQLPTASALTKTDDTNVTLTLGGSPTVALLAATSLTLGWTGVLSGTRGGTGVNNGASTITLGGSLTTSGAFASTFTMSGITSVNFPTSGTLATTSQIPTGAALTKTDDTNVTLSLGGSPTTALVNAASLTLGWTGQLALTRGGTNASLTASNGGIIYSTASAMAVLAGTATAGQMLQSGASTTPAWSTTTYPATNAVNTLLYASSANVMAALATANSSVLVTSAGGVPSLSTALPSSLTATNMNLTTPTLGVASATSINFGGGALSSYVPKTAFTPTFTFATPGDLSVSYATQVGLYERNGNIVNYIIILTCTPTFTTASGAIRISIPLTALTGGYQFYNNLANDAALVYTGTSIYAQPVSGQTYLQITQTKTATAENTLTTTALVTGVAITFKVSGTYFV